MLLLLLSNSFQCLKNWKVLESFSGFDLVFQLDGYLMISQKPPLSGPTRRMILWSCSFLCFLQYFFDQYL